MHTITICPRCGNDFMYHGTDYHLTRQTTIVDEVGVNEIIDITICQNCHEKETMLLKKGKCPQCGDIFTRSIKDTHLIRPVAFDLSVNQACSFDSICEKCHKAEKDLYERFRTDCGYRWIDGDVNELYEDGFIIEHKRGNDNGGRESVEYRIINFYEFTFMYYSGNEYLIDILKHL